METVKLQERKDKEVTTTGENYDTTTKNFVGDEEEFCIKTDEALVEKKNVLSLSLDYEGVISAWADKNLPWVIGDGRPELDLNDWWPEETVNDGNGKDYTDSSEDEYEVGKADDEGVEDEPCNEDAKEE
ncbi:hypothetical protein POM88_026270 [Heracleum sosnowskyi]|uniref:Uncharacterized protein n=1 Tax=Heracleum sosnowskyi TaxID=360622 RepID=A0AAD8I6N4_9APIA|nr:hypothetical protein POM88_026270 [Heracleum sosnowskyi]